MSLIKIKQANDVLRPGDGGFREAICIAGQQRRAADVRGGVDVELPDTDGGKNWKEIIKIKTDARYVMKYEYRNREGSILPYPRRMQITVL